MSKAPATRPSLLVRIRDQRDREAWEEFVEIYAPLVHAYGRKRGLQDADATDLMQEVLRSVAASIDRFDYDPKRGSFRGWLFTVTRNKLRNLLSSRRRQIQGTGDSKIRELLEQQPDREDDEAHWEREYQRHLFAWAAERVRGAFHESTWQAFWHSAVEGRDPKHVAEQLGMSVGAVYIARSRVLARLRQHMERVECE